MSFLQQFQQQGYVIIDNAFDSKDIKAVQDALRKLVIILNKHEGTPVKIDDTVSTDAAMLALREKNPQYLVHLLRTLSRTPEFFRLNLQPNIMQSIKTLLNMSADIPLYATNNGILLSAPYADDDKHPSNIHLPWHSDLFHNIPKSQCIQIWAPILHDASDEIGAIVVCPGSQNEAPNIQKFDPDADLFFHRYTISDANASRFSQVPLTIKLGQCVIFNSNIIHRSGYNRSNKIRCTMVGVFHNPDNQHFAPVSVNYNFLKQTPEEYYYELTQDPKALPYVNKTQ